MAKTKLQEYTRKRDFSQTPEPSPKLEKAQGALRFVVQKHSARRLHYDLRLELDGVLKSWALPNGPSLDPSVKRLAVQVEDHPLDYQNFEGIIPEGEYGAGEVIVWDQGRYFPDDKGVVSKTGLKEQQEELRQGLEKGKLSITLEGQKLHGSFALVKMQNGPKNWLMIKHRDVYASNSDRVLEQESSVQSGRSIQDLKSLGSSRENVDPSHLSGARKSSFPGFFSPMLATLVPRPFSDDKFIFEPKLDGYRTLAFLQAGRARLFSRNKTDFTSKFHQVSTDLEATGLEEAVLDGEIVALDKKGRPHFQALQSYFMERKGRGGRPIEPAALVYYVFDILFFSGYSLTEVPLLLRKQLLKRVLPVSSGLKLVEYFEGDGPRIFARALELGFEGLVAKEKDSAYESGIRSTKWLKIKSTLSDEFAIGGYTRGTGAREKTFGSLLLGRPSGQRKLRYVGNVGTGFDDESLSDLLARMVKLKRAESPFEGSIPLQGELTFIKPALVAEVKYAEETRDGSLRAPVFLRLREDKNLVETGPARKRPANSDDPDPPAIKPPPLNHVSELVKELSELAENAVLKVEGNELHLTHLDKMLWPKAAGVGGFSKRDLLAYLAKVSPFILRHLENRPLTLSRFPGGINGEHFFQKHWPFKLPGFIRTVEISERGGARKEYLICNNLSTLLWLGQEANLELHVWFSRILKDGKTLPGNVAKNDEIDRFLDFPDFLIFDIDPYVYSGKEKKGEEPELNRQAFRLTCQAARWLKDELDRLSLRSYVKTSGRTGLHVFVPILPEFDYEAVRAGAKTVAEYLLRRHPAELTVEWNVEKRTGKIFLDFNQNVRGKTLASIYSPRPAPEASISTPLDWRELDKVYPTDFTLASLPARLERTGDLWADILEKPGDLARSLGLKSD